MDSLCQACAELSEKNAEKRLASDKGWEHLTKREMTRASAKGCPVCAYILDHSYTNLWPADAPLILRFFDLPPTAVVNPADKSRSVFTHLEGRVNAARGGHKEEKAICRISLVCDPASSLAGLKHHIKACQRHHAACSSATGADLPTRVLQVEGMGGGQAPLQVRLLVTPSRPRKKAPYLALSYCWGGLQPLMLKTSNLRALQQGIDVDHLSPTVRDAVWVARELGMQYLWVDALCIVQDDPADKDVEISRMAEIYRGATATIAAATAKAASEGFIRGPTIAGNPRGEEVGIAGQRGHLVPTPDVGASGYTPEHPLDTRGWALQEFVLSERTLVFSDFELLWQCQQTPLSSTSGEGALNYVPPFDALPYGLWARNRDEQSTRFGTTDEEKLYLWRAIVEQYTRRGLSDLEDRGPALQGIADALSNLWGDRYRYGSWNRFMVPLLAWVQPSNRDEAAERSGRAPTWSWISMCDEIIFPTQIVSDDALLVDAIVDDPRLSGELDVLVLDARLFPAEHAVEDDREQMNRHFDLCAKHNEEEEDMFYLFLGLTASSSSSSSSSTPPEDQQGIGLIVTLVMDGVYERVGYMETCDPTLWDEYDRTRVLVI